MSGAAPGAAAAGAGAAPGRAAVARVAVGSAYVAASVALAAVAAWPLYRSMSFVLVVVVGAVAGTSLAALAAWRRWGGWALAGLVVAALVLLGVPVAVPSAIEGVRDGGVAAVSPVLLQGFADLGSGLLWGWKDLVTVDLPLGGYRNLLVPAWAVFLVGTAAAMRLAWRPGRVAYAAVAVVWTMAAFGLLFGMTVTSAPIVIGASGLSFSAPAETLVGLGMLLTAVLWLGWRVRERRIRAVRQTIDADGAVRGTSRRGRVRRVDGRRGLWATGMIALAVAVAVLVAPLAAGLERSVLRSANGPDVRLADEVSPLSTYRAWFDDDAVDEVLFDVRADAAAPLERMRIAVLDAYDGAVMRTSSGAADGAGDPGARFARVPSLLAASGGGSAVLVRIEAWDQVWMPVAGDGGALGAVAFSGPRAGELADGFYAAEDLRAAVQTAGWTPGDAYSLAVAPAAGTPLAELQSPGAGGGDVAAPASLEQWVDAHRTGDDGAALQELVDLLRARGYLSHGLSDTGASWTDDLGDYTFARSVAGHSLARIDDMFTALLEREADPEAAETGRYVAAVGDDEQFAVAVRLIAERLGFESRVVLGVRLRTDDAALPVCTDGICRGGDVSAWVEVRGADGSWAAVDVTPQHEVPPSTVITPQRDPEVPTEVDPDTAPEVTPPDPTQEDTGTPDDDEVDESDLAWLWRALAIGGAVAGSLLLLLSPILLVLLVKAVRRARRRGGPAAARIAGGWDEYVDRQVDAGLSPPGIRTRSEVAGAIDRPVAHTLAQAADRAVFSGQAFTGADAARYWRMVDHERRTAVRGWRRVQTSVSLRSLMPALARRRPRRGQ